MQTSLEDTSNKSDLTVEKTYDRIEAAFPSRGSAEMVVVKANDVTSPKVESGIKALGVRGRRPSRSLRGARRTSDEPRQDGRHRGAPDHG
jgi:hypothetical protein